MASVPCGRVNLFSNRYRDAIFKNEHLKRKRHSEEWRSMPALVTGLLSIGERVLCAALTAGSPAGLSLLRAARWRLLLPGTRCCSGSLGVPPAADTSLALIV
jgi:hypothetical protein